MLAHAPAELGVVDVIAGRVARAEPIERPVRWRLRTRIAFRLCFLYFSLYVITTQIWLCFLYFSLYVITTQI